MKLRQALLRAVLAAVAAMLVFAGPSFGVRGSASSSHGSLRDFSKATTTSRPTAAQRAAVRALHAKATWNSYGTASTLMRPGGYLTKQASGATAPVAARSWLAKHKVIFRLANVRDLRLVADSKLTGGRGHAVTFQQSFGGLKVINGAGLITVSMVPAKQLHRWKIGFASSTSLGTLHSTGGIKLSAAQAFVHAAGNLGLKTTLVNVRAQKVARGWTNLRIGGFRDIQRVRLGSYGLGRAAVPAYEAIVLHRSGTTLAYRTIVNARTGAILARTNLTDNFSNGGIKHANAIQTFPFNGELAATDGACGVRHGPYTVGPGVRALSGFAAATINTNDVVFKLFFGASTTPLITADTLFSPEQFRYAPAGGVPPGDYFVQVCDFADGAAWASPRTYTARSRSTTARLRPTTGRAGRPSRPLRRCRRPTCTRGATRAPTPARPGAGARPRAATSWSAISPRASRGTTTRARTRPPTRRAATTTRPRPRGTTPRHRALLATCRRATRTGITRSRGRTTGTTASVNGRPRRPRASIYDDAAAVTNLFVMHNRMHDFSYFLGFTEQNWNAQSSNFGNTEAWQEGDPLIGDAQSGAQTTTRDNANMSTMPDGASSVTNMYFWQPVAGSFYAPCVDGDYDQGVIGHEFGHMIENRMIGKGNGRRGFHAGAMGEAFGDLVSTEYLRENTYTPTDGEDPFATGTYATGNKEHGIRNYVMNWARTGDFPTPSTFPHVNPLNFSDMGYDVGGNEVHSDGEIWVAINNSVRQGLIDKYNDDFPAGNAGLQAQCASGELPSQNCPGNRRWIQLVFDAMLIDPTAPTLIDARNSMLAADVMRYGGANQVEIWRAFAQRGLGGNAFMNPAPTAATRCSTATPVQDCDPVPDFSSPVESNVEVTFNIVEKSTGDPPVNAKVYVGHYEGRASQIADTDPATANSGSVINNDAVAHFAPGHYDFLVVGKGHGFFRFSANLKAGLPVTLTERMPLNVASAFAGATASGDGTGQALAIDETETTNWSVDGRDAASTLTGIAGKQVTVDLAGTKAQAITDVEVSAMINPGQSRFAALRSFELWACDSALSNCATDAGYTKVYTSGPDAFPGDAPRPNAPQLIMRDFTLPLKVKATHLRLRVLTSQCTGGPAYQGEQDADPSATTDCDTNVSAASTRRFVRVSEIQAFSGDPTKG